MILQLWATITSIVKAVPKYLKLHKYSILSAKATIEAHSVNDFAVQIVYKYFESLLHSLLNWTIVYNS